MITTTLRSYAKNASMAASSLVGENFLFLLDYAMRLVRVLLLLSIWRTLFIGRSEVAGLSLNDLLTYTLIAEIFADPLEAMTGFADAFWDGSIATRFLRPIGLMEQFVTEQFGRWGMNFLFFSIPLLCLTPLMGVRILPASFASGLLFVVSLILGVSVGLALDFIFGAIAIGLGVPPFAIQRLRRALGALLSGSLIPLALLPWGIGKLFELTPFASVASAPLQLFIGKGDPVKLISIQLFWSVALWPLVLWSWRKSREKMVSYGG